MYPSKVWSSFVKVVDLFTGRPTKLLLHFFNSLVILYEFYKIWSNQTKLIESNCNRAPRKILRFTQMPSLLTDLPSSPNFHTGMPSAAAVRQHRCGVGRGKQMSRTCDWAHLGSIDGGFGGGDVSSGDRRGGSSGAFASA
jgi:hypothetical protein